MTKIWTLSGFFYVSLVVAILLFFNNKKYRNYLTGGVIITAAACAIFFSSKEFAKHLKNPSLFFAPIGQKVDRATLGQASFAEKLGEVFPPDAGICIYIALPSLYLAQELYPHVPFFLPNDQMPSGNCEYVVSQFVRREQLEKYLILEHKNNYLYKLIP